MRVALVTGGGSGIGRSAALELNKIDFTVYVVGRREEELIKTSSLATNNNENGNKLPGKNLRRGKFKSLIIDKNFEPENPKQLEELDENSCKWPIGHPNEKSFYFCGRSSLKDFS